MIDSIISGVYICFVGSIRSAQNWGQRMVKKIGHSGLYNIIDKSLEFRKEYLRNKDDAIY